MFAVLNYLHLNIPVDELAEKVRGEGFQVLAQNKGFVSSYLVKEADDRCCVVILWDTPGDAQAGAAAFGPTWFNANIFPHLASEQRRSAGPVVAQSA